VPPRRARGRARSLAVLLGCVAAAAAAPGRNLDYAESTNRLVYAFIYGHMDTCRVLRRPGEPRLDFPTLARRVYGESYRGEQGDAVVAEFVFGSGRPLHVVPLNDGARLLAFVNRAPGGGWPTQDRVYLLAEKGYSEPVDYAGLPPEEPPQWPEAPRALPTKGGAPETPPFSLSYAFLEREVAPGRLLVARQSEGEGGIVLELRLFALDAASGRADLPRREESLPLLEDPEPLLAAGAAWALGFAQARELVPPLKAALGRAAGSARATIAQALVRCGDDGSRRTLRALLADADAGSRRAAAVALAELPPAAADADALAEAITDADAETARLAAIALARIGPGARNAAVKVSRAARPEKRAAAAAVLARIDDAAAEERLLALARDPEVEVQTAAAQALTRPPRAILKENLVAFGRALLACAKAKNAQATRRLAMLAYDARIDAEGTLEALVEAASFEPKAIWALNKLMGLEITTADDCRRWWEERKARK
jgi:hypothetical protein